MRFQLLHSLALSCCNTRCLSFPLSSGGGVTALPSLLKAAFLSSPTLSWTVLRVFMSLGALLNEPPKAGGDFHPPALPETCLMLVLGSSFLHLQQEQ